VGGRDIAVVEEEAELEKCENEDRET